MKLERLPLSVGISLWAIAVALGGLAQSTLLAGQLEAGRGLYFVAAILAVLAIAVIDRRAPPEVDTPAPTLDHRWSRNHLPGRATIIFVAGVLGAISSVLVLGPMRSPVLAAWVWLVSLIAVLVGAAMADGLRLPGRLPRMERSQRLELAAVASILLLALALRIPSIESFPPEVHDDEATAGLFGKQIANGERPNIFTTENMLGYASKAALMRALGTDLRGVRLTSAIEGTLSILLLYLIVRRLFGVRPALLASALLAVAQFHIHFSRDGITSMQALFITVLLVYLVVRAMDRARLFDWLLVGFVAGLCLNVYYPARLAPVIAAAYVLHRLVTDRMLWRQHLPGIAAAAVGFVVFLAPMLNAYSERPEWLTARARSVYITSEGPYNHAASSQNLGSLTEVLVAHTRRTLEGLVLRGETSLQFNRPGVPLFDFWTSALLALGALLVTVRVRQSSYFLIASWLWLTLIAGSILAVDPPFGPRIITVIPVLMVLPALVLDAGWRGVRQWLGPSGQHAMTGVLGIFLALSLVANYRDYFGYQGVKFQPSSFYTEVSRYVQDINGSYRVYLMGEPETTLSSVAVRFLVPNVDGLSLRDLPPDLPVADVTDGKGAAFIVQVGVPVYWIRIDEVRRTYPGAREVIRQNTRGTPVFVSLEVEPAAVRAALDGTRAAERADDAAR